MTAGPATRGASWSRLDARMLLIEPVRELIRLAPALAGVLVAGATTDAVPAWVGWVAFVGTVTVGALRWVTTSYRITPEHIHLRTGLLVRVTHSARLDRVRTVDVTASPLHRLLRVATVRIGTGAASGLDLDGLAMPAATRLRASLLHRGAVGGAPTAEQGSIPVVEAGPGPTRVPPSCPADATDDGEEVLASFSPAWLRYAPLTTSGLVALAALAGLVTQVVGEFPSSGGVTALGRWVVEHVRSWGLLAALPPASLVLFVGVLVVAVAGYLLCYGGFRLSRHRGGTIHVHRGLLTTRSTSVEERRLRGVVVVTPALVGLAGGASLEALATGLDSGGDQWCAGEVLLPPCPRRLVEEVGAAVLRTATPATVSLPRHVPAARRRRHARALVGTALLGAAVAAAAWTARWPTGALVGAALPVLAAPFVAEARYRALGHAVVDGHLVAQAGVAPRRRFIVRSEAIIGWIVDVSLGQRRAGVVTVRAMTATPGGSITVLDVTPAQARALIEAATPGALHDLLVPARPPLSARRLPAPPRPPHGPLVPPGETVAPPVATPSRCRLRGRHRGPRIRSRTGTRSAAASSRRG